MIAAWNLSVLTGLLTLKHPRSTIILYTDYSYCHLISHSNQNPSGIEKHMLQWFLPTLVSLSLSLAYSSFSMPYSFL